MFAHIKKLAAVVIVVSLSIFYYPKVNTVAISCSQSGTIQITCHNELLFAINEIPSTLDKAPYGHHGRAQTLLDVFVPIKDGGLGHKDFGLSLKEKKQVIAFMKTIDLEQPIFPLASD